MIRIFSRRYPLRHKSKVQAGTCKKIPLVPEDPAAGEKGNSAFAGGFATDQKGEYTVRVTAESKAFQREKIQQFVVTDKPIPSLDLEKEKLAPLVELPPKDTGLPRPMAFAPLTEQGLAENSEIPWKNVLAKLGLVNLLFLLGILGFRYRRKLLFRKSKEKT